MRHAQYYNFFKALLLLLVTSLFGCTDNSGVQNSPESTAENIKSPGPITIVVHGGAGYITRERFTEEQQKAYEDKLTEAINTGYQILDNGGESLDAVVATILVLESSPLFNAGVGAVFTEEGKNELDASIMDGKSNKAGAVAGVTTIKSPIAAARAVMDKSPHVLMARDGAEKFAEEQGLEMVPSEYFRDSAKYDRWKKSRETASLVTNPDYKYGTVGCVALDKNGNIAAGTSTGGMTNKKFGRVGDTPIIGAGTYANNETCGVSSTGHGEFFMRNLVAYDIAALMKYKDLSLQEASDKIIMEKLKEIKGDGGIVALDRQGNIAMPFNTPGMFRGYRKKGEETQVLMFEAP